MLTGILPFSTFPLSVLRVLISPSGYLIIRSTGESWVVSDALLLPFVFFFNVVHIWQDLIGGVLCSLAEVVSIYTEFNFVQL